jgi:hypothetical protein
MRKPDKRRLESIRTRLRFGVAKPQETAAVLEAARYFGVDMDHVRERDLLLAALAEFAFGKGKRGRPKGRKGWTDSKLSDLYSAMHDLIYRVERTQDGVFSDRRDISDAQLAKMIAEKFAADRKGRGRSRFHSVEAIRRNLPAARDWYHLWFDEIGPPDDWEPPEPDYNDLDD